MKLKELKRKVIAAFAVMMFAFIATVGTTYAWWAETINTSNDTSTATVNIGDGDAITTTVTVDDLIDSRTLVPVGYEGQNQGDVNNVDLTFPVLWESDNTGNTLTGELSVTVDSIEINNVDYSGLFTVTVTSGEGTITEDVSKDVVINVEFTNEPVDEAMYDEVANGTLVITLTFEVTPN
jgi:hypothetical protein